MITCTCTCNHVCMYSEYDNPLQMHIYNVHVHVHCIYMLYYIIWHKIYYINC